MDEVKTLRDIGECEAIRRLAGKLFPAVAEVVGIGDDAAVMHDEGFNADLVLTSDPVIEGTHFTIDAPPKGIGNKAVGRVLSDIAAMGAEPLWLLINIVAPPEMPFDKLQQIYAGASALALKFGVAIIGGDLASGATLALHVFGVGKLPRGTAVCRGGASEGDILYVTGELGGSIRKKHLFFEPRVAEGIWLRENRWATAMIDLSDGLATDLRHLVEMSRAGAELEPDALPVSRAAREMNDGVSPLDHALTDGEDFELLFTVAPGNADSFEQAWRAEFELSCARIGRITGRTGSIVCRTERGGMLLTGKRGYEHYSGRGSRA